MSSRQGLHCPPAALCLVVGTVVGFRLHFNLKAVWAGAGWQLPIKSRQGGATRERKKKTVQKHENMCKYACMEHVSVCLCTCVCVYVVSLEEKSSTKRTDTFKCFSPEKFAKFSTKIN